MGHVAFILALVAATSNTPAADSAIVRPFESEGRFSSADSIDTLTLAKLHKKSIEPANRCSDEVFIRRVHLDVIGTLPDPAAVRSFLNDANPDKRSVLIETLFERPEFAEYWAMKWCDVLRVKAEYPINLWPNAVQAYHHWIRDAIRKNLPYDQFARELLTSSGSNFRVGQVNFYRAVQGHEPSAIARAVALTFMGERIDQWPKARRAGMEAFFSKVVFKHTGEWKEEIVCLDPAPGDPVKAVFPDGTKVKVQPGDDPRAVFTDWLLTKDNPSFARNIVNRIWAWLFGRGIIHEPDDIRSGNPPANPELLSYLEKELVSANYDLRHIYRIILNSGVYQQSSIPRGNRPEAEALFASYPVRRLEAEVLIDALNWIAGTGEAYESAIPEPFTFIPDHQRTIALADGSTTSQFLDMFGRPSRDSGLLSERNNQPSDAQRLYMLNSSAVQRKIERSWRMRDLLAASKGQPAEAIRAIYVTILSRNPTDDELAAVNQYLQSSKLRPDQVAADLAWSLINTKEFLYRH